MSGATIISSLPGRLRLRGPGLRGSRRNEAAQADVRGWDGVISVEGNPATGSILLRYDSLRIPPEVIEARVATAFEAPAPSAPLPEMASVSALRQMNRPAKIGMLVSLTISLLALAKGRKLHAVFGVMHLAFLAAHLLNHRKKLVQ